MTTTNVVTKGNTVVWAALYSSKPIILFWPHPGAHYQACSQEGLWRIATTIVCEIEGSDEACLEWMFHEGIEELGGRTAADLLDSGRGDQVIAFLVEIVAGLRG